MRTPPRPRWTRCWLPDVAHINAGVILVAAGLGTRLGAGLPKGLVTVAREPLVVHAVRRQLAVGGVSHVVVVAPASHASEFRQVLAQVLEKSSVPVSIVEGGAERSDSVRCGLRALDEACEYVLVHDAARAFAPPQLSERVLTALVESQASAVIPGVAVVDTIKVVDSQGVVSATPHRRDLRAVQTPQGFVRSGLQDAHASELDATDDAALIERAGGRVRVIEGDQLALKVTTPIDIVIAEHLMRDEHESDPL